MNKTTPEEAKALAIKHGLILWAGAEATNLAALIDEVRGMGSEPVAEVSCDGVMGVHFTEASDYGCALPVGTKLYTHPAPSQPAAPVELPVVAWLEHHKGGDNLNWEQVDHPYAKADALVKLSDAQAAIEAAGRKAL